MPQCCLMIVSLDLEPLRESAKGKGRTKTLSKARVNVPRRVTGKVKTQKVIPKANPKRETQRVFLQEKDFLFPKFAPFRPTKWIYIIWPKA